MRLNLRGSVEKACTEALEGSDAANLNMEAKAEQPKSADASEVMLEIGRE